MVTSYLPLSHSAHNTDRTKTITYTINTIVECINTQHQMYTPCTPTNSGSVNRDIREECQKLCKRAMDVYRDFYEVVSEPEKQRVFDLWTVWMIRQDDYQ